MELRDVLVAIRTGWWLPVLGAVLGHLAAVTIGLVKVPLYTTEMDFFVSTTDARTTAEAFQGSRLSEQRLGSYARLLGEEELAGRVVDELGLDLSPSRVAAAVDAAPVDGTVLIAVRVTETSPELAWSIADGIAAEFPAFVARMETAPDRTRTPVMVTLIDAPELPTTPSTSGTTRDAVLGVGLGLVLGGLAAVARRRLDGSVREPAQAARLAGAPFLGVVLWDRRVRGRHVFDPVRRGSAESYRQVRNNLLQVRSGEPPRVVMVTSALPAEGKTSLVVNLGLALAEAGRRVVLVDADLRDPGIATCLGLREEVGLTDALAGTAQLPDTVQPYRDGAVDVLVAGSPVSDPGHLLASRTMARVLEDLAGTYDVVLVDTPPVLPLADATGLAAAVDGVVLSARYGRTDGALFQRAALSLGQVGATLLGVVLNIVPPRAEAGAGTSYGYKDRPAGPQPTAQEQPVGVGAGP